jgi:enoyl-CoA hydratase/carnithine racemase
MNIKMFEEIFDCFSNYIYTLPDIRVAILSGSGKYFTVGLDLKETADLFQNDPNEDRARLSISLYDKILKL